MKSKYSIPLVDVIKEFKLEEVYVPAELEKIMVSSLRSAVPVLLFADSLRYSSLSAYR